MGDKYFQSSVIFLFDLLEAQSIHVRLRAEKMKITEFTNNVDPDEAAHDELPHLELHCLPFKD